ncbi:uncharacterized protein LOC121046150, partial [Ixodes scapularis]|uniref:uncharacterized protein LOC121046150 n=1 Tax=Ixodes scapularis TaxID=6945 RepID=UPI001AD6D0EC
LGLRTEPLARRDFEQQFGVAVVEVGLLLHPDQPWLCGSPDGIFKFIDETCLLEVKCPYKCKDKKILDASGQSIVRYLQCVDNKIMLKESHRNYTKVQILLYLLNARECFVFVYSSKQNITVRVAKDDAFLQQAVPTLEDFYFQVVSTCPCL